jgi:hypothetical protein
LKNKRVITAILLLVLATLACDSTQPTQPPTLPTPAQPITATATLTAEETSNAKENIVVTNAPLFLDPNYWQSTPQSCHLGMARIVFSDENNMPVKSGSSMLIHSEAVQNQNGSTSWVYWLITANHNYTIDNGNILNGKVSILPKSSLEENIKLDFVSFKQIVGAANEALDISVVTLIDQGNKFNVLFNPLGIDSLISGNIPTDSGPYYTFDYPEASGYNSQFTTSYVWDVNPYSNGIQVIMETEENSSVPMAGSSGSAICNQAGQVIGIHSMNMINNPHQFIVEPNPDNIQDQVKAAINEAKEKLKLLGYIY